MTRNQRLAAGLSAAVFSFVASGTGAQAQQKTLCGKNPPTVAASLFMADTRGKPLGIDGPEAAKLFAALGIRVTWKPAASPVRIVDDHDNYGGNGVLADPVVHAMGFHNLIVQGNGDPVSYTLTFAKPVIAVRFRRTGMVAGPSGVSHPHWIATARGANEKLVATVSEGEIRAFDDVAGQLFELRGSARIKSVTFWGDDLARLAVPNGYGGDGQANIVIDDLGWCP